MPGWYTREILEPGRQPMLFALLAFLLTFLITRTITRMIRAGRGPFHDVSAGDTHIHHVVPGLIILLCGGVLALGSGSDGVWRQVAGLMFGIGAALVLDEFAMVLHLDDVYWSEEGRLSADAITLASVVMFCALLLIAPNQPPKDAAVGAWVTVGSGIVFILGWLLPISVTILKGKLWMAAGGLLFIPFAWIGAVRLAKPGSPWAHMRYQRSPEKMTAADHRDAGWQRFQQPVREWIQTHVFGLSRSSDGGS